MAMNLTVNPESLRNISTQIGEQQKTFANIVSAVESINGELPSHWTGSKAEQYKKEIDETINALKEMSKFLTDTSNNMASIAQNYEQANSY